MHGILNENIQYIVVYVHVDTYVDVLSSLLLYMYVHVHVYWRHSSKCRFSPPPNYKVKQYARFRP